MHNCDADKKCTNTIGSYDCVCEDGFAEDIKLKRCFGNYKLYL